MLDAQSLVRKNIAESALEGVYLRGSSNYDPSKVHLGRVTGGYSSVIQVSAQACRRLVAKEIGTVTAYVDQVRVTGPGKPAPLDSPPWPKAPRNMSEWISVMFEVFDLRFTDRDTVEIELRGWILATSAPLIRDFPEIPQINLDFAPLDIPRPAVADMDPISMQRLRFDRRPPSGPSVSEMAHPGGVMNLGLLGPKPEDPTAITNYVFGAITATIRASLSHINHPGRAAVEVFADTTGATVTFTPADGVATAVWAEIRPHVESETVAKMLSNPQIPITPMLSLVGVNSSSVRVNEFAKFESTVFPVSNWHPLRSDPTTDRQAIAIAIDVAAGSTGIENRVGHFIGASDYGVIHDELVFSRVFRHKWNNGGFDRYIKIQAPTTIPLQNRIEDATVYGHYELTSLTEARFVSEANLRTDLIVVAGEGKSEIDRVVLRRDGTEVTRQQVDFSAGNRNDPWAVHARLTLNAVPLADPEWRAFQYRLQTDGLSHLARPFARKLYPTVTYTRLEAIQRRMFFLGKIPNIAA